jgi:hypothetical protein
MHMPIAVTSVLSWWASAYSDHRAISVTIRFLHMRGWSSPAAQQSRRTARSCSPQPTRRADRRRS